MIPKRFLCLWRIKTKTLLDMTNNRIAVSGIRVRARKESIRFEESKSDQEKNHIWFEETKLDQENNHIWFEETKADQENNRTWLFRRRITVRSRKELSTSEFNEIKTIIYQWLTWDSVSYEQEMRNYYEKNVREYW